MSNAQDRSIQAHDVTIKEIYHPKVRPGYACWTSLWRAPTGELLLAFAEKRRAPNPSYRPIPLDFYESMALPIKYQASFCNGSPDLLDESVIMRSRDEGASWEEIGRSGTGGLMNVFGYASLPDGTILRGIDTAYLCFSQDDVPVTGIEQSTDGGNTWVPKSKLLEPDFCGCIYRLKRLHDGTLVALCIYSVPFGPGKESKQRGGSKPNMVSTNMAGLWTSGDDGATWTGPTIVLPGISAPEPDFAELPSGDLLILNSSVQHGPQMRQKIHRRKSGLLPAAMYRVVDGTVPETVCATGTGLLVGASRGGTYVCCNDEGATWKEISSMPRCEYQPFMIEGIEDRLLCAWHKHGDCAFGEHHQFVGMHAFSLDDSKLPEATQLVLTRDQDRAKTHYTNSYTAHLSSGGKDLPNREIRFHTQMRYRDTYDLAPPAPESREIVKVTDGHGKARFQMSELYPDIARELNIHQAFETKAFFAPGEGEPFGAAESMQYQSYAVTPEIGTPNSCPLYVAGCKLFVTPEVIQAVPEIKELLQKIGTPRTIDAQESKRVLGLSDARFEAVVDYLAQENVLDRKPDGDRWRYDLSGGSSEIEIPDDFV
ncbi:MAG: sialidase family protein [Candidatus Latescibacterota bacterium]